MFSSVLAKAICVRDRPVSELTEWTRQARIASPSVYTPSVGVWISTVQRVNRISGRMSLSPDRLSGYEMSVCMRQIVDKM